MTDHLKACSAGHHNGVDAAFCSTCGENLLAESGSSSPAPVPAPPSFTMGQDREMPLLSSSGTSTAEPDGALSGTQGLSSPTAKDSSRRKLPFFVGAAVVLILGVFLVSMLFSSSTTTLRGTATLLDSDGNIEGAWDDCQGTGGYSDFSAGAGLSIRGRNGEIVGSGSVRNADTSVTRILAEREAKESGTDATDGSDWRDLLQASEGIMCVLYFEAEVEESDYYSVEIASRGALEYSRSELQDSDYFVQLTLGD